MGVDGAALGSCIAFSFGGIGMYIAFRKNEKLAFKWKTFCVNKKAVGELFRIAFPVCLTNIASCMGYVVFASLVTGMGNTVFAAHSIAVTAETIFYIPGYGLRTATQTLIGISLGEKDKKKFNSVMGLSIGITIGMMCISGVVLLLLSYPLMCIFTNSGAVAQLGSDMLRMVAFSEPFFGLMIVMEGIFYGLGKTRYTFIVETFSMWFVRILFTFICVRIWDLTLTAVWCCMIADNVTKALLFAVPVVTKGGRKKLMNIVE